MSFIVPYALPLAAGSKAGSKAVSAEAASEAVLEVVVLHAGLVVKGGATLLQRWAGKHLLAPATAH